VAKRPQQTIRTPVELSGVGIHSGARVRLVLKPASPDTGVLFERVDLADTPQVPARAESIAPNALRRTTLRSGEAEVDTVEHLLAACHGLGIDNLRVEIEGPEVPAGDGSARPFVEVLLSAGLVEQKAHKKELVLEEPIFVRERGVTLVALPQEEGLTIEYVADFGSPTIPPSSFVYRLDRADFVETIAPARTFCLASEIDELKGRGLGKGANSENTIVLGGNGETPPLRFRDEHVRHKVLDLLGDLFLVGADLQAHVIATRSGHGTNALLVRRLSEEREAREGVGSILPESGFDIREIMRLLPHRYPFLLIDRVIELQGYQRAVAIKNVTINEPFFQGHWPGAPMMPGVLQLEAMAQLAGVLLLRKLENTGKLAVLWAIDRVKLRGAVVPGDQLRIEVETLKVKNSIGQVQGIGKVGGKVVCEAQLLFTLVDA
jgi:UDP-3-O-[3-hydroxymyristoyl] N-acetylglucosamine deacetylase/3-hydroxyacyl-[acyl-carrier-protein] dehydratase